MGYILLVFSHTIFYILAISSGSSISNSNKIDSIDGVSYLIPFGNDPAQNINSNFRPINPNPNTDTTNTKRTDHLSQYYASNNRLNEEEWNWKGASNSFNHRKHHNFDDNVKPQVQPHEIEKQKTINVQIVDDPYYIPGRPRWPHDDSFNYYYPPVLPQTGLYPYPGVLGGGGFPLRNGSTSTDTKLNPGSVSPGQIQDYHWQKLPGGGPGLYQDYSNPQNIPTAAGGIYNPNFINPYRILSSNSVSGNPNTPKVFADGQGQETDKKNIDRQYYDHHHHSSYFDYYKRKRFRFEVHPGLIVAPIAAAAGYTLANILTDRPLLFEWGLVNHKHHHPPYHHHYHGLQHHGYEGLPSPAFPLGGGFPHGYRDTLPLSAQDSNLGSASNGGSQSSVKVPTTDYPILKPQNSYLQSHQIDNQKFQSNPNGQQHQQHEDPQPMQWWNPLRFLTPKRRK